MLLIVVFSMLSLIHVYWAFGGTLGGSVAMPMQDGVPVFEPSTFATILVAIALAFSAFLIAIISERISSPVKMPIARWACCGLSLVFLLRSIGEFKYVGFFKKISDTPFGHLDTFLYSPLCFLIGLGVVITLFRRRTA